MSAQQQAAAAANPTRPAERGDGRAFMHFTRPPHESKGADYRQLRFGTPDPHGGHPTAVAWRSFTHPLGHLDLDVFRDALRDEHVALQMRVRSGHSLTMLDICLSADDCQTLACALLDAAAHLRANPRPWEPPAADAAIADKAEGVQA